MLPFMALQGAVGTSAGFIGYFVVGSRSVTGMFQFAALMVTLATLAAVLAYAAGPALGLTGRRLVRLGFFVPGLLFLSGDGSVFTMAAAFGSFLGLTWSARHWLEMGMLDDAERDGYASRSCALAVGGGILATLAATMILANGYGSGGVYLFYGLSCVAGACLLGQGMPHAPMKPLKDPVSVLRQPEFIACIPLFFLESGLFGLAHAVGSVGAAHAFASASAFGSIATIAGVAGGIGLYATRRNRDVGNRAGWLGASCLVIALAYACQGASAWMPALFVVCSILKAAAGPFLSASEHVLNQRALDIRGELADRIVARDLVLWVLRIGSLLAFWAVSTVLTPQQLLVTGSATLGCAALLKYLIAQAWFTGAPVKP